MKGARAKTQRRKGEGAMWWLCEVECVGSEGRRSVDLKRLGLHFYGLHLLLGLPLRQRRDARPSRHPGGHLLACSLCILYK